MTQKVDKQARKVFLETTDNKQFEGFVFLKPDDRLQDVLNDGRSFFPVHVIDNKTLEYKVVQFNKNNINRIEEQGQIHNKMLSQDLVNNTNK